MSTEISWSLDISAVFCVCRERGTFILSVPDKAGIVVQCVGCRLRHLKSYLFKAGLEFLELKGSSWLLQAWRAQRDWGWCALFEGIRKECCLWMCGLVPWLVEVTWSCCSVEHFLLFGGTRPFPVSHFLFLFLESSSLTRSPCYPCIVFPSPMCPLLFVVPVWDSLRCLLFSSNHWVRIPEAFAPVTSLHFLLCGFFFCDGIFSLCGMPSYLD